MAKLTRRQRVNWFTWEALFTVTYATGISQLYRAAFGRHRGVISYHNALPGRMLAEKDVYDVNVDQEVFDRQMRYLSRRWKVLPAKRLGDCEPEGFFLSFDDGMCNAYTIVAPILERYGLTGLFAVCPGFVEGQIPHLWRDHVHLILRESVGSLLLMPMDDYAEPVEVSSENLGGIAQSFKAWVVANRVADVYAAVKEICARNGLDYRRYDYRPQRFHPMSWEMICDLKDRGHVIASHTWSHRILSLLSPQAKRLEMEKSKSCIEEHIRQDVRNLVYPYGEAAQVDAESMELARECGYERGFMNVPSVGGRIDGFDIPRFTLGSVSYRPHLYALISGLKTTLRKMR